MIDLARIEALVDDPRLSAEIVHIEVSLPVGVRRRQLRVRTFLVGAALCLSNGHPAHLTRVHEALCSLREADQLRLGVVTERTGRRHVLTYRQVEYLHHLLGRVLGKGEPDGLPPTQLQRLVDAVVDASVSDRYSHASTSLALDWTDISSFAHPPGKDGVSADPEAAWGHRRGGGPGEHSELFFGHYANLATMVREDGGDEVPELVREMTLSACDHDPVPVGVEALVGRFAAGALTAGDVLADSGYAHRVASHFAIPLRRAGASLVMDLHPNDRGMQGTHEGATCCNGNCYCPMTPTALFDQVPLPRGASEAETIAHDERADELSRYKLGRVAGPDEDGYERRTCPALLGKVRCPLRPASMALPLSRPEVLTAAEHPPTCCTQQTITVPPSVNAKTRQRHDYPGQRWRRSYARRSAVERSNSRIKDPATIDVAKGWCRVMGLVTPSVFLAIALALRNLAIIDAFETRQADNARRLRTGLQPLTRRRRRMTLTDLVGATQNAPP